MGSYQRAGLEKLPLCCEWIRDSLTASAGTGTKMIVFAHHRAVMDGLQARTEIHSFPSGYFEPLGGTSRFWE